MGIKPSPYVCVQGLLRLDKKIRGDPKDTNNVFRWEQLCLNLPGSQSYDPALPWVSKIRENGCITVDNHLYVNDNHPTRLTQEDCRLAGQKVASECSHHGIQDASQKRRPLSLQPGAWAGSVVHTIDDGVWIGLG